jgi:hypothetical protein
VQALLNNKDNEESKTNCKQPFSTLSLSIAIITNKKGKGMELNPRDEIVPFMLLGT